MEWEEGGGEEEIYRAEILLVRRQRKQDSI